MLRSRPGTAARVAGGDESGDLEPVIDPVAPGLLVDNVERLPADQLLLTNGGYQVYYARADQAPHVLREIGRLRELSFRLVGEGSGRAVDLDEFDRHYLHLFIWDAEAGAVVPAATRIPRPTTTDRRTQGGSRKSRTGHTPATVLSGKLVNVNDWRRL